MKPKKDKSNSMRRHTQTVSGDEQGGNKCEEHFIAKEYSSQPYGTCLICGKTVFC